MEDSKLQQTLEQKYNIKEPIYVEGRFVALLGNTKEVVCLVKLGIGKRCLVVALVDLAGDDEEYDLVSMSPLSLLTFHCHNKSKRLKVCCAFKSTKVYQLCSSEDQDEVWTRFKLYIRQICKDKADNSWLEQKLEHPGTSMSIKGTSTKQLQISEVGETYYTIMEELYPYQAKLSKRLRGGLKIKGENRKSSRYSSMVTVLPSTLINDRSSKPWNRSQSEANLDKIRFDSFVNDVTTRHQTDSSKLMACKLGKSTDDLSRLETISLDRSNNNPMFHGDEDDGDDEEYTDDDGDNIEEHIIPVPSRVVYDEPKVTEEPKRVTTEPKRVSSEPKRVSSEPKRVSSEPKRSFFQKFKKLFCPCIKA